MRGIGREETKRTTKLNLFLVDGQGELRRGLFTSLFAVLLRTTAFPQSRRYLLPTRTPAFKILVSLYRPTRSAS